MRISTGFWGSNILNGLYRKDDSEEPDIEIYDKNSQYLSKENLLSIANCRDYNVKEETEYVNRVTEIKEDAKSSTPEAIPEPVTEPVQDNLYTGEIIGERDWVGVYEKGDIVACYNRVGNYDVNGKPLYDGSPETSYCVGLGYESLDETQCAAHKSTKCCTASSEYTGELASQQYMYLYTKNNSLSESTVSCGIIWFKNSKDKLLAYGMGVPGGGGLPETGVQNSMISSAR